MRILSLFLACLLLILIAGSEKRDSNEVQQLERRTISWRPNKEGFFSHILQLKVLSYVREFSKTNRSILMGDFSSSHYGDRQVLVRLSEVLSLPDYIKCVPALPRSICQNDIRIIYSPERDVCFRGIPTWETIRSKSALTRHEVSLLAPRITFHNKFHRVVDHLRKVLGLSAGYVAIHWRRGDQLSTRCSRNVKKTADNSINCGTTEDFILYLRGTKSLFPGLPFVLITNEADADMLRAVSTEGIIVITPALVAATLLVKDTTEAVALFSKSAEIPQVASNDVNHRALVLRHPRRPFIMIPTTPPKIILRNPLQNQPTVQVPKELPKVQEPMKEHKEQEPKKESKVQGPWKETEAIDAPAEKARAEAKIKLDAIEAAGRNQVLQLAIDSVFLLDATVMLVFGMSTMHDALEAERMQRGLSYCVENQNIGSFCYSLRRKDKIYLNSTLENEFSEKSISDYLARFQAESKQDSKQVGGDEEDTNIEEASPDNSVHRNISRKPL